jgi:hypothetical protein
LIAIILNKKRSQIYQINKNIKMWNNKKYQQIINKIKQTQRRSKIKYKINKIIRYHKIKMINKKILKV